MGNRPLRRELLIQKLLKSTLSTRRDLVNRPHAPASYALSLNRYDESALFELANGVIQSAHIYIGIALNHCVSEAALDLIRVKIAPVQDAKNQ